MALAPQNDRSNIPHKHYFVYVFNKNSRNIVNKMRNEIGKTFDVHNYMSEVTVDFLLETAMGIDRKTQDDSGFDYAMAVMKQVIKNKKETYIKNKEKGIIPPTLEELVCASDNKDDVIATQTLADTVFKRYRDDLDSNDENDTGRVFPKENGDDSAIMSFAFPPNQTSSKCNHMGHTRRKFALLKLIILLSTVFRNYKVVSAVPEENFRLQSDIILKRTDGFRIKMEPRQRKKSYIAHI